MGKVGRRIEVIELDIYKKIMVCLPDWRSSEYFQTT